MSLTCDFFLRFSCTVPATALTFLYISSPETARCLCQDLQSCKDKQGWMPNDKSYSGTANFPCVSNNLKTYN